jgi:hypothetical protein
VKVFYSLSINLHIARGDYVAKCPKCGTPVSAPKKSWKMAGRANKNGKRTELTIGLFEHCGKSYRAVLGKRLI